MDKSLRQKYELPLEKLRYEPDLKEFNFKTTKELSTNQGLESLIIGQEKAMKSIKHGLEMPDKYNHIYVTGPTGTGKDTILRILIKQHIETMPSKEYKEKLANQKDFVAVYNFRNPDNPVILDFPAGKGEQFQKRINQLPEQILKENIEKYAKWLEDKFAAYSTSITLLKQENEIQKAELQTPLMSVKEEIQRINKKLDSMELDDPRRGEYLQKIQELDKKLLEVEKKVFKLDSNLNSQLTKIQTEFTIKQNKLRDNYKENRITPAINELRQEYVNQGLMEKLEKKTEPLIKTILILEAKEREKKLSPSEKRLKVEKEVELKKLEKIYGKEAKIKDYLDMVEQLMAEESKELLEKASSNTSSKINSMLPLGAPLIQVEPDFSHYKANLLEKSSETVAGIPVIFENEPTLENLFGAVKHTQNMMGADNRITKKKDQHLNLEAGSLIQANGGYLVLSVSQLRPDGAWIRLNEHLKSGKTRIEDSSLFLLSKPVKSEEIESNVKVIVNGPNYIYHLLTEVSEDFEDIFGVKAEISTITKNDVNNREQYANFVAYICDKAGLKDMTPDGVAEVIKHSARLSDSQEKLTTKLNRVANLIREANKEAKNSPSIKAEHVKKAIEAKKERHNLVEERYQEFIDKGIILIDKEDYLPNTINGLAVYSMPDMRFGIPSKISAITSLGSGKVVSVDRDAKMAGKIHNKAVGILEGNLERLYGQDKQVPVNIRISFEQNYGGIDGDSATLAEFLLTSSSLSKEPIYQGIAVTGSLNQLGKVQPIGGVNEKVEGFYDVCKMKGLTGEQGVMIPKLNVKELMLKDEILKDIEDGKFHIYAVETPEEAVEVMFGLKAGYIEDGKFEEGGLYHKVNERIKEFNELKKRASKEK